MLVGLYSCAKPETPPFHHQWDALLEAHVSEEGAVDYEQLKTQEAELTSYLEFLQANPPQTEWSADQQMAYWINLYNAFTVQLILEAYPINSIMDLEGGMVWTQRSMAIDGNLYTLDAIEKQLLWEQFKEPRIHFVLNCAAASCPPLLNKAYTKDNLQQYYEQQTRAFINDPAHNTIDANVVEVSQIFNWYAHHFGGAQQLVPYLNNYTYSPIQEQATVAFKVYDWSLNGL